MNFDGVKHIYKEVLVCGCKIEYLGGDRYKLTEHYQNGKKYLEGYFTNGNEHGKYTQWYEGGQKSWETEFQNGLIHGKCIRWHEDGTLELKTEYRDGILLPCFRLGGENK